MSLFKETKRSWLENLVIRILKTGSIPRHVAFIMDGNRRYADRLNINKINGHVHGFQKLSEALSWCLELGIKEVTVYAFSIENFKRSEEEVNGLMQLIREKLRTLMVEKEKIDQYGACIRVLGDLTLLPADIQKNIAEIVLYSSKNDSLFLNVCLSYTSREEMSTVMQDVADGVKDGLLEVEDIDEDLIDKCMYNNSVPDIVVRTSGEVRLSDFLLWQSSYSLLMFIKVLWPDFGIWNLFGAIWYYQHTKNFIQANCDKYLQYKNSLAEKEYYDYTMAAYKKNDRKEEASPTKMLQKYLLRREERIQNFLHTLKLKRINRLKCMQLGQVEQV